MTFLQIQSDSLAQLQKLTPLLHDTLTIVISELDKFIQPKSLLDNTGVFTVIGAVIATLTAIVVLFIKEYFDNKKSIKVKREIIFSEFTSNCYKILLSRTNTEQFSSEQEFYLAMTNASRDKDNREVYLFMYKDNAEKYAMAFKEFASSFSEFNKIIATYVLLTKDKAIADEINNEFSNTASNIDFVYQSKDTNALQQLRAKYQSDIAMTHLALTEKLDVYRQRVYKNLGYNL